MMRCDHACTCGCCQGTQAITPERVYNRPGLDALRYRIGDHGAFFETMRARLSAREFPALAPFASRSGEDPSIALLDAWATVADVLTFYQERLANEGYLRTATERRSVLEIAGLIGYAPRPGVASTVYLFYEIDKNAAAPVEIPIGSKAQSLADPGEFPQTFETVDKIVARREWNAIKPRLLRRQSWLRLAFGTDTTPAGRLYLEGTSTGLKPNDAVLLQVLDGQPTPFRVAEVRPDSDAKRTLVQLKKWNGTELEVPPDVRIHRALAAFRRAPFPYDPGSLAAQVLAAAAEFLEWFSAQAAEPTIDPEVAAVLVQSELVTSILSVIESLRALVASGFTDRLVARALDQWIGVLAGLSDRIARVTGLPDGGTVGAATDALAERLGTIVANQGGGPGSDEDAHATRVTRKIVARLAASRSVPPRNAQALDRNPADLFDRRSDMGNQAVAALQPAVALQLASALGGAQITADIPMRIFALRRKSLLFGSTAPRKVTSVAKDTGVVTTDEWSDDDIIATEQTTSLHLDVPQEEIAPGDWVALDYSAVPRDGIGRIELPPEARSNTDRVLVARTGDVRAKLARAAYSVSGQTTRIPLVRATGEPVRWFTATDGADPNARDTSQAFELLRGLVVYSQAEALPLAMEPMEQEICGGDDWIETDGLYTGLEVGRWLVVSGERSDVPGTSGVKGSELVMLDAVRHDVEKMDAGSLGRIGASIARFLPKYEAGETLHTYIKLASPLAYCYTRGSVEINANVVKATHGETRQETLGSGDASTPLQTFTLRQPPLTFVSANEPDGISSTLSVYVNGVEWHEAAAMIGLGPADRGFVTRTGDDGSTTLVFGNGKRGARLPTGIENVKAIYRSGIGKAGNVKAGQISQLLSRPLGVKGVNNAIEAAGGADPETRDQARKNAPLAVKALDRLVGTADYADFARTFAGIAKAASARILSGSDGVYVTVAGVDDIPIPKSSDLYRNLVAALRTYGDPNLPVRVESRELLMIVLSARIAIHPDYLWEDVVDRVRAALRTRYSFERQELGQSVVLSEVIATMQSQRGVAYVDVEALGAVSQLTADGDLRAPQDVAAAAKAVIDAAAQTGRPDRFVRVHGIRLAGGRVLPAQLAFIVPTLPDALILNRIES